MFGEAAGRLHRVGSSSPEVKGRQQKAGEKGRGSGPSAGASTQTAGRPGYRVRLTLLKNIAGVFLLPAAWVWTVSFVAALGRVTVHHQFWATEDFWFFSLGVVIWLLFFTGCLYLFGERRGRWL